MQLPDGVTIHADVAPDFAEILTPEALAFVAELERNFGRRRRELLAARAERQQRIKAGEMPDFLPETAEIRQNDWTVAPIPHDLQDRRVEITGPVDRKMVINALNSGANVFMADFEDSHSPTWSGTIEGQINLRDAVVGTITYEHPVKKTTYRLNDEVAVLLVRPRGWHLEEKHVEIDGRFISASLFDFGLYFFHNVQALLDKGSGPYFYLPKLENHREARLWNDVFVLAQDLLGIPQGTIRATVLIENILAAFEMDEILWELRHHSAGLNCGRWDYIFSAIRTFRHDPAFVFPRPGPGNDDAPHDAFLLPADHQDLPPARHPRHGGHGRPNSRSRMTGAANEQALAKVRADKEREAQDGHDGTWVAHPGLVHIAREEFDKYMPTPNQIHRCART
jgi:malate synthase